MAGAVIGLMLWVSVPTAHAQYFGQNKVQYKNFKFEVLKTAHFDIYFYPEERAAAVQAGRVSERWYDRLSRIFRHKLKGRQPLVLYASHPDFEQTNAITGALGEGTGGVTEALKRRIVLPVGNTLHETNHVIGHELVHAFQYDMTRAGSGSGVGFSAPGATRLPLWFIEGMAEYLSLGPVDPQTAMWMRDATLGTLPTLRQLQDPRFFPYRYGQALLAYIGGRWGDQVLGRLLKEGGKTGDMGLALRAVLKLNPNKLIQDWHSATHEAYDPLQQQTQPPASYGHAIFEKGEEAPINVAPALSPDGRRLLLISSKSLFSIDLFIADVKTGKMLHKLTSTALDPHFQSLQFIYSTGAWSADGHRVVFGAVADGHPVLSIYDVSRGRVEREIPFKNISEIFTPTWSPDGRSIAFSGLANGHTDLFIYDLKTDALHRITNDMFGDLHPTWSPDGRSIAFVTERFSTTLSDLDIGNYRLALLDPATGEIRPLPALPHGKHINPQWSPDNASIYFVSDDTGISNLYRLRLATGKIEPLTNLLTGVTGITAISPAISVAQREGSLVFSAYEKGQYVLYSIDKPDIPSGATTLQARESTPSPQARESAPSAQAHVNPAQLPPGERWSDDLENLLNDPEQGLPDSTKFAYKKYRSRFALDFVGQPYLVAGADGFGTFLGGGTALFFSDMLGDQNLVTALQINGSFNDVDALIGYQNRKHRWDWGASFQQTTFITGGNFSSVTSINGERAVVNKLTIIRETQRQVNGVVQYPFSRASRVEFSGGYRNLSFDQNVDTRAVSLSTGRLLVNDSQGQPSFSSLNLAEGSAALVYDTTLFGVTSPILGQRYRFEVSPRAGSLNYVETLADYRRYFMPIRPYTLAARVMQVGRYGSDADDNRLSPLFLGYPGLVRGYEFYSFDPGENSINQLFGSRIFVSNFELRMPLYHLLSLGRGSSFYGPVPIELAGFYDSGVAWGGDDATRSSNNNFVQSAGVALRMNMGGFTVLEFDFVRPIERSKGWIFQFQLTPGF